LATSRAVWKEHVEAIRKSGLRLERASGDRTLRIHATTDHADVRDADLVIIATKDDGVAKAAQAALKIAKPEAPILTIQNGLGSADKRASQRHGVRPHRRDGRRPHGAARGGRRGLARGRLQRFDVRRHPQDGLGEADLHLWG